MSLHLNLSKYAVLAFCCYGNITEKVSMKEERFMLAPGSRVLTLFCCSWAVVRWYLMVGICREQCCSLWGSQETERKKAGRETETEIVNQRNRYREGQKQRHRRAEEKKGRKEEMGKEDEEDEKEKLSRVERWVGSQSPLPGHDSND